MSKSAEPAIKSYFFGKGYKDLGGTIAESWRRNLASAKTHFSKAGTLFPGELPEKGLAVLWAAAGISVVVFGTALFLVASTVHVVLLLSFFSLIYLGFTAVYLTEKLFLALKGFFTVCPECHERNALPQYLCPKCGRVHQRLIPSSYGILRHTCLCGERLAATFFLNRGGLTSRCPDCKQLLTTAHTESRKAFVPIVGGPSVGKSAFLYSAVQQLMGKKLPELGLSHSFLDTGTESELERLQRQLAHGRPPDKTLATLPRALNLQLDRKGQAPRVLYLYDPAGEAFGETDGLVLHKYQEYLSGLIFLIDPFAIPVVRQQYAAEMSGVENALKPSSLPIEDALARILISLEEHFGLGKTARIKVPVAAVINKVDAFDLERQIGQPAVATRLKSSVTPTTAQAVRDELVRAQLLMWDQGAFVQQLEARFSNVHYFTCSSLGRMPDRSDRAFEARGVLEPLMWILASADSIFDPARRRVAA